MTIFIMANGGHMETFIWWVVIITILLGSYTFYLIRRSPRGFRLQAKLTVIFFLLVLIPTIPLTLAVSALLTQGVEMFLLPGVEQSLTQALQTIKSQIEKNGQQFIENHADWSGLDSSELKRFDLLYAVSYRVHNKTAKVLHEVVSGNGIRPQITSETLLMALNGELTSKMNTFGKNTICEVYRASSDSTINVVGINIAADIVRAKQKISESLRVYTSLSLFKKSVLEGRLIWGIATLFIIILALIAIYTARILSRGISDPIQQLASGMQQVAAGDLSSKVVVKARDEIKILVDSFNKMAEDLKISQQKLVQAERLAAWRDVARRISHEIKNSLTPIQISLHRLKTKFFPENQQIDEQPILAIQDEIDTLTKISDEFTQFARMPQVKRKAEDLNSIIQTLAPLIEGGQKPIKIKLHLDKNIPDLFIDRDQMKRALHNLLKNSIDASSIGGTIIIRTTALDDTTKKAKIEIEDQGHGMNGETISKIFEPYFTTKQRGMGLGLSIVKRIIEDHDGEIFVESKQGKGTKVTIII